MFLPTGQVNFLFLQMCPGHLSGWVSEITEYAKVEIEMQLELLETFIRPLP